MVEGVGLGSNLDIMTEREAMPGSSMITLLMIQCMMTNFLGRGLE